MKKFQLTLVTLSAALLAAGCGGGGGGSPTSTIPTAAIQISSTNATTIASGANSSAAIATKATNVNAPGTATGVVTRTTASSRSLMSSALAGFEAVKKLNFPPTVVGAALTTCMSGSGSATWTDNGDTNFGVGDTISVSYSTCLDSTDNVTKNGTAAFTINADGFTLTFTGYSEVFGGQTTSMAGDMTMAIGSPAANVVSFTMSGASIEVNDSVNGHFQMWGPGIEFASASAGTPYSSTITIDTLTGDYSFDIDMSIASTEMGGSVSIVTNPAFQGIDPADPTIGTMTITGANNTALRMIAQANGTDVLLEVDADGNGSYETSTLTTWAAL